MELKQRFNLKTIFGVVVWLILLIYVIIGLQPAGATNHVVSDVLNIPSIGLISDVTTLELHNSKLDTPDTIVGSYSKHQNKTLLIGHSTTVFQNLNKIKLKDEIFYNHKTYKVVKIHTLPKSDIKMNRLIGNSERDTIVIMTCAGTLLEGGDATHRLLVTAIASEV